MTDCVSAGATAPWERLARQSAAFRRAAGAREFRPELRPNFQKIPKNFAGISAIRGACSAQSIDKLRAEEAGSRAQPEQVGVGDKAGFFRPCGHTPYLAGKTHA
jgi:hypothetical protein